MLQDAKAIRYYQRITDAFVDQWNRGYRTSELRLYLEGYLASLRHSDALEPYWVHRLEEDTIRYLNDQSNFIMAQPEPEIY
ncbi:MAG: hypothetical protein DCF21_21210 [Leptolyngbya sp.]|jgi:hypothetical protein|uniref:Uncharacterized protein n=1 Tax=Shackletoniella antarctica TaxID=268115 RepID=A0A2W4XDK6_9CYAN|nr:MAG: hypothetical protein DCF17_21170 [Shackletoniella antarctica]PZV07927.1 MAG: hypothetical protein DCF21_21210 [Leptolyngbya sp.]